MRLNVASAFCPGGAYAFSYLFDSNGHVRPHRITHHHTASTTAPRMAFGKISLKGRALRYLAAREYSRTELERKLRPHEETPGELARTLDALVAKDFISETRVVASVIHRRAARLGTTRIRHELQAKGIDAEAAADALRVLRTTELPRAGAVWRSRFDQLPQDAATRGKQSRFLLGRGFAPDVVRRVLAGGWEDEDADADADSDGGGSGAIDD